MVDPSSESYHQRLGFNWRLKPSKDHQDKAFERPVVFELTGSNGSTLATFAIPPETLHELLRPHLSIFAELLLDGSVSLDSEFFALFPSTTTTDILELVRQALAPEMLDDEPQAKEQIQILKQRLTDALTLVDQTLANLDKPVT